MIVVPLINTIILYFMIGLAQTAKQFFIFYLNYFLISFAGASLGLLIGSAILDAKSVAAVVPIILLPFILFSGFFKNNSDIPMWIGWIQYISPIKYGFIVFTLSEVEGKPSLVNLLDFDVGLWASVFILLGLGFAYRFLSLFFLWLLKKKAQ